VNKRAILSTKLHYILCINTKYNTKYSDFLGGYTKMSELKINRKKIPIGEVAYFIRQYKDKPHMYYVDYGTVEEHYATEIVLQLYVTKERRLINGIPYNDFTTPTEWRKLPKGWTYSTELYELDTDMSDYKIASRSFYVDNPEDIKAAIAEGLLVKIQDKDFSYIETEIDRKLGFRLIRKSDPYDYHPSWISRPYYEVFETYEEAQKKIFAIEAEYKRISELSDYDWSVELIDRALNRGIGLSIITEHQGEQIRDRLLAMDRVEDIEVRLYNGGIQWKYWKNKRWITIEL